jgi:hypothetical protein
MPGKAELALWARSSSWAERKIRNKMAFHFEKIFPDPGKGFLKAAGKVCRGKNLAKPGLTNLNYEL